MHQFDMISETRNLRDHSVQPHGLIEQAESVSNRRQAVVFVFLLPKPPCRSIMGAHEGANELRPQKHCTRVCVSFQLIIMQQKENHSQRVCHSRNGKRGHTAVSQDTYDTESVHLYSAALLWLPVTYCNCQAFRWDVVQKTSHTHQT